MSASSTRTSKSRALELARVDGRLSDWKRRIDDTTWKSIHQVFADQKVDIGMFYTAEEFHTRLLAYLDEQVKKPSRGAYQTFKTKVWDSPIKDQWLPVISTDELTAKAAQRHRRADRPLGRQDLRPVLAVGAHRSPLRGRDSRDPRCRLAAEEAAHAGVRHRSAAGTAVRQRRPARNGPTASGPRSSTILIVSEPMTATSALPRSWSTSSRPRMPKPTASGRSVAARQRAR